MVPHPTTFWRALAVALAAVASAFGQTAVEWQPNSNGSWNTGANWSGGIAPGNSAQAMLKKAVIVTANGAADASVKGLDIENGATALFDFLHAGYTLRLGSSISSWTAGKVEMRRTSGIYGHGVGNTILNLSPGVELLYSTEDLTRYLYNLTVNNGGTIRNTSGTLYFSDSTVANLATGLIHADGAEIRISGSTQLQNAGTLRATGTAGKLRIENTLTTAHLGLVDLVDGGRALLSGTLDNTSATLNAPSGGRYELLGGTLRGGIVGPGALTFTSSGGVLEGVVLNDNLALPASAAVHLTGNATFTGTSASLGDYSTLYWEQNGAIEGRTITQATGSNVYVNGNYTLTIGGSTTVTGDINASSNSDPGATITVLGTVTHDAASQGGSISASRLNLQGNITVAATHGSLTLGQTWGDILAHNTGILNVNAAGATLFLDGEFNNTGGTINALEGNLVFRGNNLTSNLTGGTINLAADTHAYLQGVIDNTDATLTAPTGGPFELYGGTLQGGSIAAGALAFTSSGGYLDGAVQLGDLTLAPHTHVRFKGNASFAGANATLGSNATLILEQDTAFEGKAFAFGASSSLQLSGADRTLTFGSASTGTGTIYIIGYNSGQVITLDGALNHTSASTGFISAPTLLNRGAITNTSAAGVLSIGGGSGAITRNTGSISVNGPGATIYLEDGFDTTGGALTATQGSLIFRGSNTTAHLNGGIIDIASGGRVLLNGTLDNTATTLLAPASGRYELYGGTIENGTISAGALSYTTSDGRLRGVTLEDDLVLPSSAGVRLEDGTNFTGNLTLGSASWLTWRQSATLADKTLAFGGNSGIYLSGADSTLVLASTVAGSGDLQIYADGSLGTAVDNAGTLTHTSGTGYLSARLFRNSGTIQVTGAGSTLTLGETASGYATYNTGSITVNGPDATLYFDGAFDNTDGSLNATQGRLIFRYDHATTQLNSGTINIGAAGRVLLQGTLDNTGQTLNAPATGMYELYSGTIENGQIAPGALGYTSSGGTLQNVTLLGNVALPASSWVTWTGGTALGTAGARLGLGDHSWLYWQQNGTIDQATVDFGPNSSLYFLGTDREFTLGAAGVITGDVTIQASGYDGARFTNLGSITHTGGSGSLTVETVVNSGTINVTGGNLYLGYSGGEATFLNAASGVIRLAGGNATVNIPAANPLVNEGAIHLQSGTLYTLDRLTNSGGGWIGGSGVIHGDLNLAGGTLSPGNAGVGNLRLTSGQLTVSGAATFAVDIDHGVSDQLIFQSPGGIVDLGSGLITLSLNLLSAPAVDATFTLVSVASSSYGMTGYFAGLPHSGDTVTALLGGDAFTFSINYQPSFVSLTYQAVVVPEPSTYALMAGGLLFVAAAYRRRRRRQ